MALASELAGQPAKRQDAGRDAADGRFVGGHPACFGLGLVLSGSVGGGELFKKASFPASLLADSEREPLLFSGDRRHGRQVASP